MGDNNLITKSTGDINSENDLNQFHDALTGDLVPRNRNGIPTDLSGSLGGAGLDWMKAHISNGYWSAGDIKSHHSYNGVVPIDQGWFPCNGDIISEVTYDAFHGAGSWSKYIVSSIFETKHAPLLIDRYLVGAAETTEDGTIVVNSVGNSQSEIDIEHTHLVDDHNHQWYIKGGGDGAVGLASSVVTLSSKDQTYNSSGALVSYTSTDRTGIGVLDIDAYTNENDDLTTKSLSTTQSIKPESIEVEFYLRIV